MSTKIVGSNMPDNVADALKATGENYGANAYNGASSDTPGQDTRSALAGKIKVADNVPDHAHQKRTVSDQQLPAAGNLSKRDCTSTIPDNGRPVTTRDVHTDLGRRVIDEAGR